MFSTWTFRAAAIASGLVVCLSATPASAITYGASCANALFSAAGGIGNFTKPCAASVVNTSEAGSQGIIKRTIDNFFSNGDLARGDPTNWNVMNPASTYGLFSKADFGPHASGITFWSLAAGNTHEFGYADNDGTDRMVLIANTQTVPKPISISFSILANTDPFVFYAYNAIGAQKNNYFFTDPDVLDILNDTPQATKFPHFAILEGTFGGVKEFLLFIEDLRFSDNDYNDAVIQIVSQLDVPEPATVAILGAGLVGAGLYRRRRMA